jgi:hypothetical protein
MGWVVETFDRTSKICNETHDRASLLLPVIRVFSVFPEEMFVEQNLIHTGFGV